MSAHCSGALVPIAELASETKEFGKWCAASWNTRIRCNCLGNSRGITDCEPCVGRERVPTNGGIRRETETARGAVDSSTPSDRATTRGTDSGESSAGYRESCKRAHTSNGNKEFLSGHQSGNKPETFAGDVQEWKGWSFKMRQYTSDVDGELFTDLVDVEANSLRELLMENMNQPQKTRTRQLALMLTMHTKDRARQMITKLSDPCNRYEIWRRFLEEWEPAHRGRYRAMLTTILQFTFARDRG